MELQTKDQKIPNIGNVMNFIHEVGYIGVELADLMNQSTRSSVDFMNQSTCSSVDFTVI